MQGAIARVCMVVAAAILNHPLLFPQENATLPEQDEELMARMQQHEEKLEMERARLEKEISQLDSKQEETRSEEGYSRYFWSTVSFVIFFTIEMCRVQGGADTEIRPVEDEDVFTESGSIAPRTMVLDKDILSNFCDKCTYTKVIVMNIIPVVQLEDTDAYFVSHFPSDCDSSADPYWSLSFAVYEKNLLKHFAKRVPQNSCHLHCLQIVTSLNQKQTGLTGKSALTNYHLKTALMHLLLTKRPSVWGIKSVEHRLRDVLSFLQRSLHEKRLHHILIGNIKVPEEVQVPEIIRKAEPINLFRSLVLQRELYAATVRHFNEMLRNAPVLIQEYTPH